MSEVHLTLIQMAEQIYSDFIIEFDKYKKGYAEIDTAESFELSEAEMEGFRQALLGRRKQMDEICEEASSILNSVSGYSGFVEESIADRISDNINGISGDIINLEGDINTHELTTLYRLDRLEKAIDSFGKCVQAIGAKGWTGPQDYKSGDFFKNSAYISLKERMADIYIYPNGDADAVCAITSDYSALVYNGEKYYLYLPDYSGKNPIITQADWKTVAVITLSDGDFDWLKAISGLSISGTTDVKENPGGVNWATVNNLGGLSMSIGDFLNTGWDYNRIKIVLQKSGNGSTRASIGYSTKTLDNYFFNYIEYGKPVTQFNEKHVSVRSYYSQSMAKIYTEITGEEAKAPYYSAVLTWDERHQFSDIVGFITFDENGNMYQNLLIYGGDKVVISEVDGFGVELQEVLDVTDYLRTPGGITDAFEALVWETLENGKVEK